MPTKTNDNPLKFAPIAALGLSVASNAIKGHRARKQQFEQENPGQKYQFDLKSTLGDAIIGANQYTQMNPNQSLKNKSKVNTSLNDGEEFGHYFIYPQDPPMIDFNSTDYAQNLERNLTKNTIGFNPFGKKGNMEKGILKKIEGTTPVNQSAKQYLQGLMMSTISGSNSLSNSPVFSSIRRQQVSSTGAYQDMLDRGEVEGKNEVTVDKGNNTGGWMDMLDRSGNNPKNYKQLFNIKK